MTVNPKGHVKFDDEKHPVEMGLNTFEETSTHDIRDTSYSESESDDEAPEEQGMSSGKTAAEDEIKHREELLKQEQLLLKEKRRKNDAFFKDQQQSRKERARETQDDDMLEELPDELLVKLDEGEGNKRIQSMPTHINFNEIDEEDYIPEIKKQLQDKKKKTLKSLRVTSITRGPVAVKLLSPAQSLASMAPKREASIMNTKDKWLRRKAVRRK